MNEAERMFRKMKIASSDATLSGSLRTLNFPVASATAKITAKTTSGGPGWTQTKLISRKPRKTALS